MIAALHAVASELPRLFRENASEARRLTGDERAAHVWEQAAQLAEEEYRRALLEPLTLDQAARESGYGLSHVRRLVRDGTVPNSGSTDDVRIVRAHLPRKPGHGIDSPRTPLPSSPVQAARAATHGGA